MKKLVLNTELCIGCGACVGIDPEHFDFNEENLSHVISEENLDTESLHDAIDACPVGIISIEDAIDNIDGDNASQMEEETGCQCVHCHGCCSEKAA